MTTNILADLSAHLVERARAAAPGIAAIRLNEHRHLTGTLWRGEFLVASAQSLPLRDSYDVVLSGGSTVTAAPAGRDPGTNIALLKLPQAMNDSVTWADAETGAIALAFGADGAGGATARMGLVSQAGPEWHSSLGGRIDRRIVLDIALARAEEGGPVFDANGARLGITTFGPRRQVLAIPSATIERIVPLLAKDGHVARGWLGVALQPVAVPDALIEQAGVQSGLMVMSVAEAGPAAGAGVLAGDIVLSVDGLPTRGFRRIAARLGPDSIGRKAALRIIRGGAILSLDATIAARPAS